MTANSNVVRVMIADKQAAFRESLRTFLEPERDVTVVGEASDAKSIPAFARQLKPDVLLIEAALFQSVKDRMATLPGTSTMVTVPSLERAHIIRAFLDGAKAVVPKSSSPRVWLESIRAVCAGQYWLGTESIEVLVHALRHSYRPRTAMKSPKDCKLTPRELEIMDKIAIGHSNKEVGRAFSIRERTVKHHLTNIFTKVGVSSRLELALFAAKHQPRGAPPAWKAISVDELDEAGSAPRTDGYPTR
jgi:two-component system nitrate/nitrite response regulator NarL